MHRAGEQCRGTDLLQHRLLLGRRTTSREVEKATNGKRKDRVDRKPLRHVTHSNARRLLHDTPIRPLKSQKHLDEGRLSGAIRPDQRDDLPAADLDPDMVQNRLTFCLERQATACDQNLGGGCVRLRPPSQTDWHAPQIPCSSTVCRWTENPARDAASPSACATAGSSISPTAPHSVQISNCSRWVRPGVGHPT